jgi:hypothetical protein
MCIQFLLVVISKLPNQQQTSSAQKEKRRFLVNNCGMDIDLIFVNQSSQLNFSYFFNRNSLPWSIVPFLFLFFGPSIQLFGQFE